MEDFGVKANVKLVENLQCSDSILFNHNHQSFESFENKFEINLFLLIVFFLFICNK